MRSVLNQPRAFVSSDGPSPGFGSTVPNSARRVWRSMARSKPRIATASAVAFAAANGGPNFVYSW
jgi:hypothetical protein